MVFKCQEDSFLKEFTSKVISCVKVEDKKNKQDQYEVILEDTILFPEGGGQPCDYGFLNNEPVQNVIRRADKAVHFTSVPLQVGEDVKQTVDWDRRFDNMQQHSGQHLLSAVLERDFECPTISWWLGEEDSYVELDTPAITEEQIQKAERIVNDLIRQGKEVSVKVYNENTSEEELKDFRSVRGLPADHKGDIRVINIEDTDSNMCCGTHVRNLSQLQMIKLLHSEKSKRKDKILLHFLVGNRVLKRLEECIKREQQLTVLLKSNAVSHPDLVDKLQKNSKLINKNLQTLLKELAVVEAEKLKQIEPTPSYFCLHKKEAEPDFINNFIREFDRTDVLLFLSVGDEKTNGNFVLYGNEEPVAQLGPKISELLKGKGAGKGNKYQAKVACMANRSKAEQLVIEYFKG